LGAEELAGCHRTYDRLLQQGLRVLAVAFRQLRERESFSKSDECHLTLAGFVFFVDPPVLCAVAFFHAGEALFHTGWFVESLATQTLVLFVIRTFRRPWQSRPSPALAATTIAIVAIGVLLPWDSSLCPRAISDFL
jgi:magnesium-transporting ATPase (P-type)